MISKQNISSSRLAIKNHTKKFPTTAVPGEGTTRFDTTFPAVSEDARVLAHQDDDLRGFKRTTSVPDENHCLSLGLEDPQFHGFTAETSPIVRLHSSALLLSFVAVLLFLERFHRQLSRFDTIAQFIQMGMVAVSVISSVASFDIQALFRQTLTSLLRMRGLYIQQTI